MNVTVDQVLAHGRQYTSFAMGMATFAGISSIQGVDLSTISTSFDHIFNGVKEIAVGVGPLVTIGMGWWASHRLKPSVQVAATSALPGVQKVVVSPAAPDDIKEVARDPNIPKVGFTPAVTSPATS